MTRPRVRAALEDGRAPEARGASGDRRPGRAHDQRGPDGEAESRPGRRRRRRGDGGAWPGGAPVASPTMSGLARGRDGGVRRGAVDLGETADSAPVRPRGARSQALARRPVVVPEGPVGAQGTAEGRQAPRGVRARPAIVVPRRRRAGTAVGSGPPACRGAALRATAHRLRLRPTSGCAPMSRRPAPPRRVGGATARFPSTPRWSAASWPVRWAQPRPSA